MRRGVLPLLLLFQAFAAQREGIDIRTATIAVHYDQPLHRRIRWLGDQGRNIVAFDPAAQPAIEANGRAYRDFPVDPGKTVSGRVNDPEFGPAMEAIVVGVAQDATARVGLERRVRVLLPDKFPDVAIFETSFRNLGAGPVRIGQVESQRLLLDRKQAELDQPPHRFASFQGGAYRWGRDYSLIWLEPGFRQSNFQGLDDRTGPEGEGGGMPFIDVWVPSMGVALAHIEKTPQWVWLPVEVRADGKTEIAVFERPLEKYSQQERLTPGETYQTVKTAVIFHRGDYHDALRNYGELLRARGIAIPRTSPPSAYEPYWKSWGFEFGFTTSQILDLVPELKLLEIRIANLDDGWFDWYGDWNVNRAPGKFPRGVLDIQRFVADIHQRGLKTNLWWYPLGVSPESRLKRERPDLLVQEEKGGFPIDDRKVHQLCPAYPPAIRHIEATLERFVAGWGFDGVYVDCSGLSAVPPCFNPAHKHASPLDSFRSLPKAYQAIHDTLRRLRADPWIEVCICGLPHSPYYMPYYFIANASDPVSLAQVRRRVKLEKAIRGPSFCVGDCYQVPLDEWKGSSVPQSFETAMGVGAQVTTFYADLTGEQRREWQRWFRRYRELGLSSGEYLNLYDIAFDKPETHVVRKGADLFYGIFADYWPVSRRIELRGLDPAVEYEVEDYANEQVLGKISGRAPYLNKAFKDHLLLRVRPAR